MNRDEEIQPPAPAWVGSDTILVAEAQDLLSKRAYRVWYDFVEAERQVGWLSRRRRAPFAVEQVETGARTGAFSTWAEVEAWHDRAVISPGWRIVTPLPLEGNGKAPGAEGLPAILAPESSPRP